MAETTLLSASVMAQFQRDVPLVVGFSGGPDSAALLHALHTAGWRLVAAHLDHGLRESSAAEAAAASQVAAGYAVPFVSERADVAAHAQQKNLSLEAAARAARYAFLFRVAEQYAAQAVLVAHTADDQAETLLMHLLRGSGPQGLQGMPAVWQANPWNTRLPLVRPMLAATREQVLAYCQTHALAVLHDPSNQDPVFFRNRIRHELLPLLEQQAPGLRARLLQTSELLSAENEVLTAAAEAAWRASLADSGTGYVGLQRAELAAQPLALQRRVLQRAARQLRPATTELNFALVEQARQLLAADNGGQDWFEGLQLLVEDERLWLAEDEAALPAYGPQAPEAPLVLSTPMQVALGAGWVLHLRTAQAPSGELPADPYQAWLQPSTLTLRRPQAGERMALAQGSQKLSDLFINAKLPRRARATWPLVCAGDRVLWAPGLRLAHGAGAPAGQRALHVQLLRA